MKSKPEYKNIKKLKGWGYCCYCDKEMSAEDVENWKPPMCCSGIDCGCMGMPIEPPICIACDKKDNKK